MTRKKSAQCTSPRLQDAVERYIEAMFSDLSHLREILNNPAIAFLSSQTEEILIEIGQQLKGSTAFRDLNDLAQFLMDSFLAAVQGATEPEKQDLSRLAAQITR